MKFNLVSIETLLYKLSPFTTAYQVDEADVIEHIADALLAMEMPEVLNQQVSLIKVENYHAEFPVGFKSMLQIVKYNKDLNTSDCDDCIPTKTIEELEEELKEPDLVCCLDKADMDCMCDNLDQGYKPYFIMNTTFFPWTGTNIYQRNFEIVRPSNHSFFNSIICSEANLYDEFKCCDSPHEFSIVGASTRRLRFSFEEGYIAMAYYSSPVDEETGYPMIPETYAHLSAIQYYVKWKIAESLLWSNREGAKTLADDNERKWLKYIKQANNKAKMPQTVDDMQEILEDTLNLIPMTKRYYGFFGNLGRSQNTAYKNPRKLGNGRR